jgi:hypothetical protein
VTNSEQSNRTATTTSTADNRVAADNGAIVVGDGSVVEVIDGGAFALVGDLSERAFDLADGAIFDGVNLAADAMQSSNDALAQIIERDRSEDTQLASQLIRLGIPAVAIVAAAYFVWGTK